jgi:hypothetical protein
LHCFGAIFLAEFSSFEEDEKTKKQSCDSSGKSNKEANEEYWMGHEVTISYIGKDNRGNLLLNLGVN